MELIKLCIGTACLLAFVGISHLCPFDIPTNYISSAHQIDGQTLEGARFVAQIVGRFFFFKRRRKLAARPRISNEIHLCFRCITIRFAYSVCGDVVFFLCIRAVNVFSRLTPHSKQPGLAEKIVNFVSLCVAFKFIQITMT